MICNKNIARHLILALSIGAALLQTGRAQTPTGTVQGTVTDPTNATVPGCDITVRELQTNALRTTTTQENGFFAIPLLPAGSYELTVKRAGFKAYTRSPLRLDVNQTIDLPITLSIGDESQVVTVTTQAPLLETTTSSIGQVVGNQQIVDMPLSNRNILQLDTFVPGLHDFGATSAPATSGSVGFGRFEANGGPTNSNEFMLDGATNVVANLNSTNVVPTIDAVQDTKILTSNIPAEFGRTGGIVFNATYKTGTNSLHGTVYSFNRNRFLYANTWVNDHNHASKPFANINTFGFSLGGPVWLPKVFDGRNRLFFFTNYEGYRDVTPITMLLTVPTLAERNGDFSGLLNASGTPILIYDPATTTLVSGNTYTRQQFSYNGVANVIPPSRLDPVGVKLMSYYPQPNATPTNTYSNTSNYLTKTSGYNVQNEWAVKVDYNLNANNTFFIRYTSSNQGGGAANVFGNTPSCSQCLSKSNPAGSYSSRGGGASLIVIPKNTAVGFTHVISPSTVLDLRAVVNRQLIIRIPQSTGFDLATLGMPSSLQAAEYYHQFPPITVSNFQGLGTYANNDLLVRGDTTIAGNASVTVIRAKHSIKAGGDYRMLRYNESGGSNVSPAFTFDQTWTQQNPYVSNSLQGAGLASLLLGIPTGGSTTIPSATALQWFYGAVYAQDDWRVSSRLTLNLGLRYDLETPYTDRFNRATYFNPTAASVATTVDTAAVGGLQFVGKDTSSRYRFPVNYKDVGPRVGLAYKVTNSLVFHAAYGMLYQPILTYGFGASASYGQQGYTQSTSMTVSSNGGLTPTNLIDNPFPGGLIQPTGNTLGTATFLGQSVTTQLRYGVRTPYIQQFSAGFEEQLGATLIGLAYVGSHGVHEFTNYDLNQLTPANYTKGAALAVQVSNPFFSILPSGTGLSTATVATGQLLRPFPQFSDVVDNYATLGTMTYSSLQAKVEHRYSRGFSVLGAYTWGKNMGNVGERYANAMSYQNSYNLGAEESYSPLDIAHNLTAMATYMLPVGRGQLVARNVPLWANVVVGGWQLNGMFTVADGAPLQITSSTNALGFGAMVQRPNRNFSMSLKQPNRTPAQYFNTAAFTAAPQYTYGSSKPYDGNLRGVGANNINLALDKNASFGERGKLQFRAEFYNVLNHPMWASPGSTFGSSSFGVSPNKANNRSGQLALKLMF